MQNGVLRNYHTHTVRCKHARDTDGEYAEKAYRAGFETLGFSDHSPWPFTDGHVSRVRMDLAELEGYCASVRALRKEYEGKMRILLAMECEAYAPHFSWLREIKEEMGMDYLILGNHFSDETEVFPFSWSTEPEHLRLYTESTLRGMESGLFACLCHPEVALFRYPAWDQACEDMADELCKAALSLKLPLEYNLLGEVYREKGKFGPLGYPLLRFWEKAAEYGNTAVIGVDAHSASALEDIPRLKAARERLEKLGLKVLDSLEGPKESSPA